VDSLPSDGPAQFAPVDDEVDLWNAAEAPAHLAPLVAGGLPLPRGAVTGPDQVRLFVRGRESPVQARSIAFWPDGSVKWMLLVFPLDGQGGYGFAPGAGEGDQAAFRVTLRKGEPVPCALRFGKDVRAGAVATDMKVEAEDGAVRIATGPLVLRLAPGQLWLAGAALDGREMLRDDGRAQAHVDFLRPQSGYAVGTTHPEGAPDPGPVRIDKVEIEEGGPLRAVVRLEGRAEAQEQPRVILRLEAYAGRPFVRLFHTVEFLHKDPRLAFVRRMGLHLPLALEREGLRVSAGGQKGPVALGRAALAGLRQTSHLNYEIWQADPARPYRQVRESAFRSRGWLDASDGRGGVAVVLGCMWQESPKEIAFRAGDPAVEVGLWPESAPLMDVRRYSNYPHRGQGESTPDDHRWVLDYYYRNDPFVGVTRTHEMLILFHRAAAASEVDAVAADFQSRPLVYAGWPWYSRVGVTMPLNDPDDPKFSRFNANIGRVADWWLFHQRVWGWYGMWDFGDVRHLFRSGYGQIYAPDALAKILSIPPEQRTRENLRGISTKQDYFTQNDWAFDNGRWGWGNTEGLPNLFMAMQYLRTGRRDLFFFVEACARHSRDVDARHAGKWFGAGTRHGVQHWSDGNHEERQTTFTEQRFHYLLTGEHRTREWCRFLSDNHYLKGQCSVHAAHSGRSYGLLTLWEMTGDAKVGETLRNYMHCLAQPEGIDIQAPVKFPEGTAFDKPRDVNSANMFFYSFGGMHAVLEYYYLTGDERVRESLLKTAEFALAQGPGAAGGLFRKVVAFAARHAPDGERYRKALADWAAGPGFRPVFQQVTANRGHWTGETAHYVSSVPGAWFWLNDAVYTLGALEAEPELSPGTLAQIQALEDRPVTPQPRLPRGSWQSEYDRPELREYVRDRLRREAAK